MAMRAVHETKLHSVHALREAETLDRKLGSIEHFSVTTTTHLSEDKDTFGPTLGRHHSSVRARFRGRCTLCSSWSAHRYECPVLFVRILGLYVVGVAALDDTEQVIRAYEPLRRHPDLFDASAGWKDSWFDRDFKSAMIELKSGVTPITGAASVRMPVLERYCMAELICHLCADARGD
jgi:hypothetical protein